MKKPSLKHLGFFAIWLVIGGIAILKFAPELFTARDAAPSTGALPPSPDVPPLDEASSPHFYSTETTTSGSAAPSVDRTADETPTNDSLVALPGAAAPAAAPTETADLPPWQTDTSS